MIPLSANGAIHELSLDVFQAATYVFHVEDDLVSPGQDLTLVLGAPSCGSLTAYVRTGSVGGSLLSQHSCTSGCNITLASACDASKNSVSDLDYYVTIVTEATDFAGFNNGNTIIPIRFSLQVRPTGQVTRYEPIFLGSAAPALTPATPGDAYAVPVVAPGPMVPASYVYTQGAKALGNFESLVVELRLDHEFTSDGAVNATQLTVAIGAPVRGCQADSTNVKSCTIGAGQKKCTVPFKVCDLVGTASDPAKVVSLYMSTWESDPSFNQLSRASVWVLPDYGFVQTIETSANYSGVIYSTSSETYAVPLDGPLVANPRFRLTLDLDAFGFVDYLGLAVGSFPTPQCGSTPSQWPTGVVVEHCQIGEYFSTWPMSQTLFASVVANVPSQADLVPYILEASFEESVTLVGAGPECFTMPDEGIMFFQSTLPQGAVYFESNVTAAVDGVKLYVNLERLASPACHSATCNAVEDGGVYEGFSCVASPVCPSFNPISGYGLEVFMTVTAAPGVKFTLASSTTPVPSKVVSVDGVSPAVDPLQVVGAGSVDEYYTVHLPRVTPGKEYVVVVWSEGLDNVYYSDKEFPANQDQCGIAEDESDSLTCSGTGESRICYVVLPCSWDSTIMYVHPVLDAPEKDWPYYDNFTAPWSFNVSVIDYTTEAKTLLSPGSPIASSVMPGQLGLFQLDLKDASALAAGSSGVDFVVSGLNAGAVWGDVYEYPVDGSARDNLCFSVASGGGAISPTGATSHNMTVPVCRTHTAKYYVFVLGLTTDQPGPGPCVGAAFQLEAVVDNKLPNSFAKLGMGSEVSLSLAAGEVSGFEVAYTRRYPGYVQQQAFVVELHSLASGSLSGKVERQGSFLPQYELCDVALEGDNMATVIPGCIAHAGEGDASNFFISVKGESIALPFEAAVANLTVYESVYTPLSPGVAVTGTLGREVGNPGWEDTHLYQISLPGGYSTGVVIDVGETGSRVKVEIRPGECSTAGDTSATAGSLYMESIAELECRSGRCVNSFDRPHATISSLSSGTSVYNVLVRGANTNYTLTVGVGGGNCAVLPTKFCPSRSYTWQWADAEAKSDGAEVLFEKLYCAYRECDATCKRDVTPQCNATLQAFACATAYPACDGLGLLAPPCQALCTDVTDACGLSFSEVGLPQYDCYHNYFEQPGFCTNLHGPGASPAKKKLPGWAIFLIVLAVLVGLAAIAGVVYVVVGKSSRSGYDSIPEAINEPTPTPVNDPGPPAGGEDAVLAGGDA